MLKYCNARLSSLRKKLASLSMQFVLIILFDIYIPALQCYNYIVVESPINTHSVELELTSDLIQLALWRRA